MKISFIIPCYNSAKYISDVVDSIYRSIAKTYVAFEVIIINDGSTDNTVSVVESLRYKNLRLIELSKNLGPGGARNCGLDAAIGQYIVFVDADDLFEIRNDDLVSIIDEMDRQIYDLCIFSYSRQSFLHTLLPIRISGISNPTHSLCVGKIIKTPWGKIIRRKHILKNKCRFPENLIIGEDLIFNLSILQDAKVCYVNRYIIKYNTRNPMSVTSKPVDDTKVEALMQAVDESFDLHGRHASTPSLYISTFYPYRSISKISERYVEELSAISWGLILSFFRIKDLVKFSVQKLKMYI